MKALVRTLMALSLPALLGMVFVSVLPLPPVATPAEAAASDAPLIEIPVPQSPTVALRVVIETGSVDDPYGKFGLCSLTMHAAAEGGTPDLTKTEVADRLYPMAASIDVRVDRETTVFSGRVRKEDLEDYYPIFWNAIFHPRLETADIERLRDATLSGLIHDLKASNDEQLGKEALQSLLFQGTPWEHPAIGYESGLRAIQPEDVRGFHRWIVVRPLVHVGIAGSYPPEFAARVRADIASLRESPAPARTRRFEAPAPAGVDVELIDKPARSTAISIGFPHDVRRGDPDYWPLFLATNALGEHRTFHGRLQREMRSVRGLNYGNYAYLDHFEQEGWGRAGGVNMWRAVPYFSIWIRPVQPENGVFALAQGVWELRNLIRSGLTQEEFDETREHVRNVSQLWEQTLQRRLGLAMDDAHFGGRNTREELTAALDTMTVAHVNTALQQRFNGRNLRAVMVCAHADSMRAILQDGRVPPIVYAGATAPDDVRAKDAEIENTNLGTRHLSVVRAEDIYK
jgi:zinc protease